MLIALGAIVFLGVEWTNPKTFGPLPVWDKVMAALFQSVTPRTAGIATVDYGQLHPITLLSVLSSCLSALVLTLQGAALNQYRYGRYLGIVYIIQQPLRRRGVRSTYIYGHRS